MFTGARMARGPANVLKDIAGRRMERRPAGDEKMKTKVDYPVRRPLRRSPTHPGELMREILTEHLRLPIAEAARRMKVSRPSLYAVLNGEGAVTAEMALRF